MRSVLREFASDAMRVAVPHVESHIVVRFTRDGIDVHAIGARERVHRKQVPAGMRVAMARLPLGATERVLGVSARQLANRVVPLAELWGDGAHVLRDRIAATRDLAAAAALVEQEIAVRIARIGDPITAPAKLALAAADKLDKREHASVRDVADELGISERQLRRVFRDAIGVGPKSFARLARFHRAVDAARAGTSWTRVASATGYCDQAHLIDEFHTIAGTTPRMFMTELADAMA